MDSLRENTIKISFPPASGFQIYRFEPAEIQLWIQNVLKIPTHFVSGVQIQDKTVYVKLVDKLTYDHLLPNIIGSHPYECVFNRRSEFFQIPVTEAAMITNVKLTNLPFEVSMHNVSHSLKEFGRVVSWHFPQYNRDFVYPVKDGTVEVKMVIDKNIPKEIKYSEDGRTFVAHVVYEGQERKCQRCSGTAYFDHFIYSECPRRGQRL